MRYSAFTILFFAMAAPAADEIRLPKLPAPAVPMPAPDARMVLKPLQRFVIDSDIPLVIRTTPKGNVAVAEKAGPLLMSGEFCDNPGVDDDRSFKGKFIYVVKFAHAGDTELLIIPKGFSDEKEIITRLLDCQDGTKPLPPPPGPDPAPVVVKSFRVIFVTESGATLTAAQNSVQYAKAVEEYLNANCTPENNLAGWWRTDKDADGKNLAPTMGALWAAVKPKVESVPVLAIEVNGNAKILPWPKDVADCLATLKKYREGGK